MAYWLCCPSPCLPQQYSTPGCIHCGWEIRLWRLLPIIWDSRGANHLPFQILNNWGQHKEQNQHQIAVRFSTGIPRLEIMAGLPCFHLCSELVHPIIDRKPRTGKVEASLEADALRSFTKCKPGRKTSPPSWAKGRHLVLVNSWGPTSNLEQFP